MDRLGPWDAARRVAVAVSGGADSLALAVLAQGWGRPAALIVDHGLRADSGAEAEAARAALWARGMPARVLRLDGLHPGPGLAARAREARYAALSTACREAGLVDLLLGHHAGDQAETVLMRRRRGSGAAGLAGMAALVATDHIRLLRPLLRIDPAALRTVVAEAGLVPCEDPGNTDQRSTRARLRREIGTDRAALLAEADAAGAARAASEAASAAELAQRASIYPEGYAVLSHEGYAVLSHEGYAVLSHEGYAVLSPGPGSAAAFGALLRSLSGHRYPAAGAAFVAEPRPATIAGVRLLAAGRAGDGWLMTREVAAMAAPLTATGHAVWDGRFRLMEPVAGAEIGALGADAAGFRRCSALPAAVLHTLPALRYNGVLAAVPHLTYCVPAMVAGPVRVQNACLPAAGAPFLAC